MYIFIYLLEKETNLSFIEVYEMTKWPIGTCMSSFNKKQKLYASASRSIDPYKMQGQK